MIGIVALLLVTQQPLQPVAEGIASYYTVASSGGITASGEPLRDGEFTCAMRDGEFGTYYLIVADDGRSVACRLNDRGPYVRNRVVDLSRAAMRKLAGSKGMAKVRIYRLGRAIPPSLDPALAL